MSPPRVEGNEIKILREEEIGDLLARLRGRSLYMIGVLGLATGMRRGEMLALRWQDVDLAGKVRVERSLEHTKAGGLRFKTPKTKAGRRAISIPPSVVAAADLRTGAPQLGGPTLELVREIQAADPTRSLDKMSKRQRAMLRLKDELGELADRPGRAPQAKKQKAKGRRT